MNCCDDFGNCNQGRDCPIRVARIGQRMKSADPMPTSIWRDQIRRLAFWMLVAVIGSLAIGVLTARVA
jgi:hypothetical protein